MRKVCLRDVVEYWPGHVWVYEDGRVWSERGGGKWLRGSVVRGRRICSVRKPDGSSTMTPTARVVAMAFVPNPEGKPVVNHIDGDKSNDHYENLEWTTVDENERHACEMGLKWSKLSREQVVEMKHLLKAGRMSFKDLAERFDVPVHTVQQVNDGRIWRHVEGFEYPIRRRPRRRGYLSKAKILRAKALLRGGSGYREIAAELGMGRDTIRKVRDGEYDWKLKK